MLKKQLIKNKNKFINNLNIIKKDIGNAYIKSTVNNIIITITDINNNVISWSTSYSAGFKEGKKSIYFSSQNASERSGKVAIKKGVLKINVFFKGICNSKELIIKGFCNVGIKILSVTDRTPIPFNGCKVSKIRKT